MQALNAQNLPTPQIEEWKYTNLPKAIPAGLKEQKPEEQIIHIPRGQICEQAENILFIGQDGTQSNPRLKIILEEGAQLTFIERHNGKGAYWKNMATEITLGQNARLTHIRQQDDSIDAVNTNMVFITMARDAHYDGFTLNVGGKLTRHEITALLQGPNIECHFNGINLLSGKQHGDTTILIEHQAPHCQSNQFYRSILDDQSHGVFQGKVHVHQIAQKTDGYQLSNALLLSSQAEMDTKPELEIYADDVKCSHGATTGQMDEAPLFYLRARGLNEAEARLLLATAFIDEVIDKVSDEDLKTEIGERARTWLQTALTK